MSSYKRFQDTNHQHYETPQVLQEIEVSQDVIIA